jgi:exopolysaccharide biosynthesis predicted pyruvyltransferase EpsI
MLNTLKNTLNQISSLIEHKSNVVFLDYPFYFNVGDLLIMHGTLQFFRENNIHIKLNLCKENFSLKKLKKNIDSNTTIILQGGGNFGDIYNKHQELREKLIQNFPDNRIILLPQSVHFSTEENLLKSQIVFNQHKNLYLFARDSVSYDILKKFSPNTQLMPDMAHYLHNHLVQQTQKKEKTLLFLRRDKEMLTEQLNISHSENTKPIDWADLISKTDIKKYKKIKRLMKYNKILNNSRIDTFSYETWEKLSYELIQRSNDYFLNFDNIITSRLHAHIFGSLLNIRTQIIDNNYKKNSLYHKEWTSSNQDHTLYKFK